jgi:ParB family chromosome partitioning protein
MNSLRGRCDKLPKTKTIGNLALASYEDIFMSTVNADTAETAERQALSNGIITTENVVKIPLSELHPPEFHPFNVNDDEAMDRLACNIKQNGVLEPGLVRPRQDGGYELIAGNRRKRGCEIAGLPAMPVIIREMSDADAAIAMVDSNLEQRETLLFSEKAWAYKVKMEALNHNGIKGDKHSFEIIMEQTGESKNQIYRLIRLTELVYGLLDMVDTKQIAFNPAVELSYLSQAEQMAVITAMETHGIKPSLSQAVQLKKLKQDGELTTEMIDTILFKIKKPIDDEDEKGIKRFRKYFPDGYTAKQMNKIISDLLREWQSREELHDSVMA